MNMEKQYELERAYAEGIREMLRMHRPGPEGRRDMLVGRQSRQGVRHALQALCLARGRDHEPSWDMEQLLEKANPGHDLSIGVRILDQYPTDGGPLPHQVPSPITVIPDHIFMCCADISMILEVAKDLLLQQAAS